VYFNVGWNTRRSIHEYIRDRTGPLTSSQGFSLAAFEGTGGPGGNLGGDLKGGPGGNIGGRLSHNPAGVVNGGQGGGVGGPAGKGKGAGIKGSRDGKIRGTIPRGQS